MTSGDDVQVEKAGKFERNQSSLCQLYLDQLYHYSSGSGKSGFRNPVLGF